MKRGFSLIEMLVAMLMVALLAGAVSAALAGILRLAGQALRLDREYLAVAAVSSRRCLGVPVENPLPLGWKEIRQADDFIDEDEVPWDSFSLHPVDGGRDLRLWFLGGRPPAG